MKKIKVIALAVLFSASFVKANPVNVSVAQKVAENFYSAKHSGTVNSMLVYTERDANAVPVFYVFNVNNKARPDESFGRGFVIVTAEDAAHPIIGYSDEGSFVIPTADNNVSFWLQNRKNEVIALRSQNIKASSDVNDEWGAYTTGTRSPKLAHSAASVGDSVLPLLVTYWDQSPFYNDFCPGGSVTGCVATAMAQIMKYWDYPKSGTGLYCYNDPPYGNLCESFDTVHYYWADMPARLGRNNYEVAKLMYDCGVSVAMDYSPSGSGAFVVGGAPSAYYSYTAYFGYDASTINTASYNTGQQSEWISILENELNNHRVMQFQGTDPTQGGHSWVCDGYSSSNEMHMNWGWSGTDDGYYAVNSMNPSPYNFDQDVAVIYGIEPPPGLGIKNITNNSGITVYPNPSHGVFNFDLTNNSGNYHVNIYNVLGQEVNTTVINTANSAINLSAQPKGIYIYRILTEKGQPVSTGRLVVE